MDSKEDNADSQKDDSQNNSLPAPPINVEYENNTEPTQSKKTNGDKNPDPKIVDKIGIANVIQIFLFLVNVGVFIVLIETLNINKKTMIASNTPYIEVLARMKNFGTDSLTYEIRYKNNGNTPVLDMKVISSAEITPPTYTPRKLETPKDISVSILSPNDSCFTIPNNIIKIPIETLGKINSGIFTFKIYGYLVYKDVFDCEYRIDFFNIFDPKSNTFIVPNSGNKYKRIN